MRVRKKDGQQIQWKQLWKQTDKNTFIASLMPFIRLMVGKGYKRCHRFSTFDNSKNMMCMKFDNLWCVLFFSSSWKCFFFFVIHNRHFCLDLAIWKWFLYQKSCIQAAIEQQKLSTHFKKKKYWIFARGFFLNMNCIALFIQFSIS